MMWLRRLRCHLFGHRWQGSGFCGDRWCPRCRVLTFTRTGIVGERYTVRVERWGNEVPTITVEKREGVE